MHGMCVSEEGGETSLGATGLCGVWCEGCEVCSRRVVERALVRLQQRSATPKYRSQPLAPAGEIRRVQCYIGRLSR